MTPSSIPPASGRPSQQESPVSGEAAAAVVDVLDAAGMRRTEVVVATSDPTRARLTDPGLYVAARVRTLDEVAGCRSRWWQLVRDRLAAGLAQLLRIRWLVRLPVAIYRARLGILFGGRLLMLQHTGRHSGRPRRVVLEVVERREPSCYVVVSGFGDRAQWLRNIDADPEVQVYVRSRRAVPAAARRLGAEQASTALQAYREGHPRAWRTLRPVLEQTLGTPIDEQHPALPMVGLTVHAAG